MGDVYSIMIGKQYAENFIIHLYIDKGIVNITGDDPLFKNVKTSGSKFVQDENSFNHFINNHPQLKGHTEMIQKSHEFYTNRDSAGLATLIPQLEKLDSISEVLTKQWILQHSTSPVSSYLLSMNIDGINLDDKEMIFNQLSPL